MRLSQKPFPFAGKQDTLDENKGDVSDAHETANGT